MAKNTLFDGDAYWNDSWVQELDGDEERLYHFYITSPNLDKSGVYKQPERLVEFYVHGLGMKRIREITEKFAKAKKVIRCGEWIIVPTSLKHQNYRNNQKIIASIIDYLKKIPDEVFEALRECDYPLDLNAIKPPKNVKTGNPFPTTDDTSPKTDDLSMTYPCSTDDLSPKTDEFNLIESNSTKFNSIESEFNINSIQDIRQETPETLSSHFIRRWQQNADVFNCIARLKQPKDWQAFWEQNTMTLEQTDLAIDNFIAGVKSGAVDRRFIPSSPDTFVLNGWLQRSAEPFKKQGKGQRIANDNVADDDIDKYFREA
jgi:hypothetical protein